MEKYIGIPFVDGGRTFGGVDCYGLVQLFYKHEFNIDIPDTKIEATQPKRIMINFLNEISKNWKQTTELKKGTVVAMAMHEEHPKLVTHFAIMIDKRRILHAQRKRESHIMDVDNPQIKSFIRGFYEWQH